MGKASTKAQNKYIAKAYDRVNLTLPKGRKEALQAHAQEHGESLNGFINRAIDSQIERDGAAANSMKGEVDRASI
jgi:predicted HicB family RNase H-like nuclease